MKRWLVIVIACLLLAVFLYAAYQVWTEGAAYLQSDAAYSKLDAFVSMPKSLPTQAQSRSNAPAAPSTAVVIPDCTPDEGTLPTETFFALATDLPAPACTEAAHPDNATEGSFNTPAIAPQSTPAIASAITPDATRYVTPVPTPTPEREYDYPDIVWPEVDFEQLREINPEIIGWLYLENSPINYPIAQAEDNAKYLTHIYDGTPQKAGCPFLNADNAGDFSDWHSIIYAHNLKNGTMFGSLCSFKKQQYYDEHPRFLLLTADARYVLEIVSGHVTSTDSCTWQTEFDTEEAFSAWLETILSWSGIETNVVPEPDERIITLSTCSYEFNNARYVVHCVQRKARTLEE